MFTRYTSHGSVQDLHDIISLHRRVLYSMSLQGVRHFVSLNHLAEALSERWYQLAQMNDIEESISLFEEALGLCTSRDERRAIILGNLAQALLYLNIQNAEASRYSSAISLLREALSLGPLHNDILAILKTRLCSALVEFYVITGGKINGLHEAIDMSRSAAGLLHIRHRDRPEVFQSLALVLRITESREPGTEAKNYTEDARLLLYRILETQSPTHPRRASCLSILGCLLGTAYSSGRGSEADLDEGIRLIQEAITLITPSHTTYPSVLSRLAVGLAVRFYHFHKNSDDLDHSITMQEQAMNARPLTSGTRYYNVHNLAIALETRYKYFGDLADLHHAILLGREALVLCPPGHYDHMCLVVVLSLRLILCPSCLVTDINEMVSLLESVLENEYKPEEKRSGKSVPLCVLARLLHARFLRSNDPEDRARFTKLFEAAVQDEFSSYGYRFQAAKQWISAAESLNCPEMAMKAYRMGIHISPYRTYPGLDLPSQLDQLRRDFATVSCDAACCALVTADASEALTLLEQGRATFWAQRLQLRMSFDGLSSDLSDRLHSATKKLQECYSVKRAHNATGEQRLLEQRLHYETFRQLMREARLYTGFTDFFRPIQIEQLADIIGKGFFIVLLSSKIYGSFAIIIMIRDGSLQLEKLPLSSVTAGDLQAMVDELQVSVHWARQEMRNASYEGHARLKIGKGKPGPRRVPDATARLWSTVGEPIMRHLGIEVGTQQPKTVTQPPFRQRLAMLVV
jgi:tetratricopeptide (TPR) repeat protein